MASVVDQDVIALLLLMLLGVTVSLGVVLVILVCHWVQKNRSSHHWPASAFDPKVSPTEKPFPTGPSPSRWLAIKSRNPAAAQAALGLHNPTPCSWADGIATERDRGLFISPPIAGWILVFGPALPDPADDIDACFRLLLSASKELGEVQFFSANRVLNHHAWAIAASGRVIRAYAWAGETLWNQGQMTSAERALEMKCLDYGAREAGFSFDAGPPTPTNAEKVPTLAGRWSIDPTSIDEKALRHGSGIAGDLSSFRPH